jgi:hypothetical protein
VIATDDLEPEFMLTYELCRPFTMTTLPRMYALYQAVRHVVQAGVPGAFVECGVWKGGSAMLAARTLSALGASDRDLFLYDTFAGMPTPSDRDIDPWEKPAMAQWTTQQMGNENAWCYASLEEVRENLSTTGYPPERIRLVKGLVEETIPKTAPASISVLRLDTDWYESTKHELLNLYPLVSAGGILILDDYGYWRGARQATDEFFDGLAMPPFLNRIDSSARIGVKPR